MQEQEENEISIFDLLDKLRHSWKLIAGGFLMGIAGAAAWYLSTSPKYEAALLIRVGSVGQISLTAQMAQATSDVNGLPIESPELAAQRIMTPTFQQRIAERLGDKKALKAISSSSWGEQGSFKAKVIKSGSSSTPLIELLSYGSSPDTAKRKVEAALSQLAETHAELARPALANMRTDLANQQKILSTLENDLEHLTKIVKTGVRDDRFSQLALIESLRVQKEREVFFQRQKITALEHALSPPMTQATRAFEPIFTSAAPVSPKWTPILVIGGIGGLLFATLWIFILDAFRRRKQPLKA